MDNVKNDLFYLEKLREDLKFIVVHTKEQQVSGFNLKGGCRYAVCNYSL